MFRYTLLNGIRHWAGNMSQTAINEAWIALDKIGRLDDEVTFHPYWSNQGEVGTAHSTTLVSYYRRPGKLLLIVNSCGIWANTAAERATTKALMRSMIACGTNEPSTWSTSGLIAWGLKNSSIRSTNAW